jgi:hypothetical protein
MRSANGKTVVPVNGNLIAQAITGKGLSVREVARRCGVTFNIVHRMTRKCEYSGDLAMRHLIELADLLDLSLSEILDSTPSRSTAPRLVAPPPHDVNDHGESPNASVSRLARYVLLHPSGAAPAAIAVAFGWTLPELHAARRELNPQLAQFGMQLRNANDAFYMTTTEDIPRSTTLADAAIVAQQTARHHGMNKSAARVIDGILHGRKKNTYSAGESPSIAWAVNIGILSPGDAGDFCPTQALLDAFIDPHPAEYQPAARFDQPKTT